MKNFSKFILASFFACGYNSFTASAQDITSGDLIFVRIPKSEIPILHPGHKGPTVYNLPLVQLDDELEVLSFVSHENISFSYYIEDSNGDICLQGTLSLQSNQNEDVSVATLTAGSYNLYIEIGDAIFVATFGICRE